MSTKRAFSLIELLSVLAIVLILVVIALPSFIESKTTSELSLARVRLAAMKVAMEDHLAEWGSPPADFNDPGSIKDLYRTRKTLYGYYVCRATPLTPKTKGGLQYMGDPTSSVGSTQIAFYNPVIHCPLTSPVRYISDNQTIDPFSDGTVPFRYDSREHSNVPGDPHPLKYGAFFSAGPDKIAGHWNRGFGAMGGCAANTTGIALPYSPTNGTNSCGELWGTVSACVESGTECLVDSEYIPRQYFGPEFPESDEDGDHLNTVIESHGPNNGDGNHDGVLDSQQSNVASLPDGGEGDYVALTAPAGTIITDVSAVSADSVAGVTPGLQFPLGLIGFQIEGVPVDGKCDVVLRPTKSFDWESYYKQGPTPESVTATWYSFIYDGTSGAEIHSATITLHFMDGALGDDDLQKDLTITDLGGPTGVGVTSVSDWGLYEQ